MNYNFDSRIIDLKKKQKVTHKSHHWYRIYLTIE